MSQDTEIAPKIDSKLPLPWILACTVTIALSMGSVFAKLDAVSSTLKDVQADMKIKDTAQIAINQSVALQKVAVEQLQTEVAGIKADVAQMQRGQRYVLK